MKGATVEDGQKSGYVLKKLDTDGLYLVQRAENALKHAVSSQMIGNRLDRDGIWPVP
jgi:hypothetical protein